MAFIENYIDPTRIKQYFEQSSLTIPLEREHSEYHEMLTKHKVRSDYIYDGPVPCDSDLKTLSLRQALDYTRRLITKLCFRAEDGGFGAPNNLLSESLSPCAKYEFGRDFERLPNTQYSWFFDHCQFTKLPAQLVFLSIQSDKVCISREVGENEIIEKTHCYQRFESQNSVKTRNHAEKSNQPVLILIVYFFLLRTVIDSSYINFALLPWKLQIWES